MSGSIFLVLLQQFPLPVHQFRRVLVPVTREFAERGAAGDERGIDDQLAGAGVTELFQLAITSHFSFGGAVEFMPQKVGMLVGRKRKGGFDDLGQTAMPARRHTRWQQMFHRLAGDGSWGNAYEF